MAEQLIKKNCTTGEYEDLYPVTDLSSIKDLSTGKTLDKILESFNHLWLPFKDNSKALTRQQVPDNMRRKGLWVTYLSCKGKVTTEIYNSNDFSDEAWGKNENWKPYIDKQLLSETIKEMLSWYKA